MWSNKKKTPSEQPKPEENFEDPYATSWPSEEEGEGFNAEDPSYEAPIEGDTGQYDASNAPEPSAELGKAGPLQKPQQSQVSILRCRTAHKLLAVQRVLCTAPAQHAVRQSDETAISDASHTICTHLRHTGYRHFSITTGLHGV
jgi:hypothetical protein